MDVTVGMAVQIENVDFMGGKSAVNIYNYLDFHSLYTHIYMSAIKILAILLYNSATLYL